MKKQHFRKARAYKQEVYVYKIMKDKFVWLFHVLHHFGDNCDYFVLYIVWEHWPDTSEYSNWTNV